MNDGVSLLLLQGWAFTWVCLISWWSSVSSSAILVSADTKAIEPAIKQCTSSMFTIRLVIHTHNWRHYFFYSHCITAQYRKTSTGEQFTSMRPSAPTSRFALTEWMHFLQYKQNMQYTLHYTLAKVQYCNTASISFSIILTSAVK